MGVICSITVSYEYVTEGFFSESLTDLRDSMSSEMSCGIEGPGSLFAMCSTHISYRGRTPVEY